MAAALSAGSKWWWWWWWWSEKEIERQLLTIDPLLLPWRDCKVSNRNAHNEKAHLPDKWRRLLCIERAEAAGNAIEREREREAQPNGRKKATAPSLWPYPCATHCPAPKHFHPTTCKRARQDHAAAAHPSVWAASPLSPSRLVGIGHGSRDRER